MSIIFPGQPASYYSFGNGILGLNGFSIQAQPPVPATTAYELTLENDGHGTVSASTLSGFPGDSATLSTTPSTDYEFSGYDVTGGTIEGNTFIYGNTDATARACFREAYKTLTLQTDGHGTLTATSITGRPGDTVTLTPTYDTYYRFSGYDCTGGTIEGNTFTFGEEDATAKANFKVNAFTASGNFDKGSNITCSAKGPNASVYQQIGTKYAIKTYATSNTPTAWYATSNRWNLTTTPSAYKITFNAKMSFSAQRQNATADGVWATATCLVGGSQNQTQTYQRDTSNYKSNWSYSKSFTSNATGGVNGLSGQLRASAYGNGWTARSVYLAAGTTGTWTATGYAP